MILVPLDAPGVKIVRMLPVFGYDDAPHGHCRSQVERRPRAGENLLLGEGRGFEIAQGRLGPGRIHHCMRTIGAAEVALETMCKRLLSRAPSARRSPNIRSGSSASPRRASTSRCAGCCAQGRRHDGQGRQQGGAAEIAMIKVAAPRMALQIIDDAIQAHGGAGVSQDFPLARSFANLRTMRLVDGPDDVHNRGIARAELKRYRDLAG